jgi:hypothetical protein
MIDRLANTWIFDLDGTLVEHGGYDTKGFDTLLPGVKEFLSKIHPDDTIIIATARDKESEKYIKEFFAQNKLRFDFILSGLPKGARVIINDTKPSGYTTAYAIPVERNVGISEKILPSDLKF